MLQGHCNGEHVPGVAHDVRVGVGTLGEGEGLAVEVAGNLAVGEAGFDKEGPRPAHGQLDNVRHDPVERHLKHDEQYFRLLNGQHKNQILRHRCDAYSARFQENASSPTWTSGLKKSYEISTLSHPKSKLG